MNPRIGYLLAAVIGLIVGFLVRGQQDSPASTAQTDERPAYLIVSVVEPDNPELMRPYQEVSGPLGREMAGAQALGFAAPGQVEVLEGSWDFRGLLLVERFRSMDALKSYWASPEYTEAKKLREGLADVNFIVAVDGISTE